MDPQDRHDEDSTAHAHAHAPAHVARCAYCGCEISGKPVERGALLFDSEEHASHAEQGE